MIDQLNSLTTAATASAKNTAKSVSTKVQNVEFDFTTLDAAAIAEAVTAAVTNTTETVANTVTRTVDEITGRISTLGLPTLDVPGVDVTTTVGRVTDVVRDLAYVGLGAAVVAAQQVDAGVRSRTSRQA